MKKHHLTLGLSLFIAVAVHLYFLLNLGGFFHAEGATSAIKIELVVGSLEDRAPSTKKVAEQVPSPVPEKKLTEKAELVVKDEAMVKRQLKPEPISESPEEVESKQQNASQGEADSKRVSDVVSADISKQEDHALLQRLNIISVITAAVNRNKRYPQRARRREWQGRTVWGFVINQQGVISGLEMSQSSGFRLLGH